VTDPITVSGPEDGQTASHFLAEPLVTAQVAEVAFPW